MRIITWYNDDKLFDLISLKTGTPKEIIEEYATAAVKYAWKRHKRPKTDFNLSWDLYTAMRIGTADENVCNAPNSRPELSSLNVLPSNRFLLAASLFT